MKSIKVHLKNNPYNIYIGKNSIDELNNLLDSIPNISKIALITNNIVADLYINKIKNIFSGNKNFKILIIPDGETSKSLKQANEIYSWLIENKFDRDSLVIAFGGGVIGDLAGFVAATYLRGIKLVQIPTTLLAQVDSSIGGKVGINHQYGKNLIGAFYHPEFVLSDINFLKTLNAEEYICGMGEVLKYALIGDLELYNYIDGNFQNISSENIDFNNRLVSISAEHKARIVAQDEKEQGIRANLNFGHTFGHALEKLFKYEKLKHGQAVLLGMKCAIYSSLNLNYINDKIAKNIIDLINRFEVDLPNKLSKSDISELLKFMQHDKKVKKEKINYLLIKEIGKVFKTTINDENLIRAAYESLN